jgi:hypothetical protein
MKLLASAILSNYRPKKDKTVSVTFELNEKTAREIGELHELTGSFGYLLFKAEQQLTNSEIKEINELKTEIVGKTKSQRLRSVLYAIWNQGGCGKFKDFYSYKMEEIIGHFIKKLDN